MTIEVHRSFVNTWECDENNHMNVQFYLRRFDEAVQVFDAMHPARGERPPLRQRHVRYHRELLAGDSTLVRAGIVEEGPWRGSLVMRLVNAVTGELCTTALDQPAQQSGGGRLTECALPDTALPRGLQPGPCPADTPGDLAGMVAEGRALVANHSIVSVDELEPDGMLASNRIVSRFTDGAPHAWEHAGIGTQWLNGTGSGRVAVEMKVERVAPCPPGSVLRLVSRADNREGRTFRIVHALQTLPDETVVARGEVRCLVMNLETRRATDLPESFRC